MLTPAEADAAIAAHLAQAPDEDVPLADCAGRVLRAPVTAERDAPPFDRVTMDGIALSSAAVAGGRRRFRVAGVQPAGVAPLSLAGGDDCLEVMTGAVLPAGADAVVPVERLRRDGDSATLEPGFAVGPGLFVHRRASDARRGDRLLSPGLRLRGPEIAVAASAGLTRLTVARRPRIAVISTGDELVEPGRPVLDHQQRRSNPQALAASLALAGYPAATDRHLPDRRGVLATALAEELARHELLVLSGGVSAGRYDFVPQVLEELGVRRVFHQVAQRPGRPMYFGVGGAGQLVFGLPGNPVSVLVCLVRYVLPALRAAAGERVSSRPSPALAQAFEFTAPLACFLPVTLEYDRAGVLARPRPTRGSGDFGSLAGTDGFVELPAGPATHPAGMPAPFYPW